MTDYDYGFRFQDDKKYLVSKTNQQLNKKRINFKR